MTSDQANQSSEGQQSYEKEEGSLSLAVTHALCHSLVTDKEACPSPSLNIVHDSCAPFLVLSL